MLEHFKVWNQWRKGCLNRKFYKFLVLIKVVHSPTLEIEKIFNKPIKWNFKENTK